MALSGKSIFVYDDAYTKKNEGSAVIVEPTVNKADLVYTPAAEERASTWIYIAALAVILAIIVWLLFFKK